MDLGYSKDDVQATLLAALLHDIGKFEQRSMTQRIKHPKVGGEFILRTMGKEWEKVANIILAHHDPSSYSQEAELAKIVAIADHLSAAEREKTSDEPKNPRDYFLHSIFSKLMIEDQEGEKRSYKNSPAVFPLRQLTPDLRVCFPETNSKGAFDNRERNIQQYRSLWHDFEREFQSIDFEGTIDFQSNDYIITSILSLLEKYTTFVPSATYRSAPDISLFLHVKSTAALAACIMSQVARADIGNLHEEVTKRNFKDASREELFRLLLCDLSGIQNFLYSVPSERALKNLKGRSVYVQLLSESLARFILKRYSKSNPKSYPLPITNIIFVGGGNFYLLLPARAVDIEQLKQDVSLLLDEREESGIMPIIDSVLLTPRDFLENKFGEKWHEVHKRVAVEKRRKGRYFLLDKERSSRFLLSLEKEYPNGRGSFSGEDYEELARKVTNARWLYLPSSVAAIREQKGTKLLETVWVFERDKNSSRKGFSVNNYHEIDGNCQGYYRIANHTAPGKEHEWSATLEDLAERCETGKKTWGVIRADVDNLGELFRKGLDKVTISRIATLSNMFSLFFSSHLQTILQREKYENKSIVVYSGGDDLFIIGSWDILVDLAYDIRTDFQRFTGRDDITLSAAIYVSATAKYPVIEAAKAAGEMLKKAKEAGKNRVCFLDDTPLTWEELDEVRKVKDQILMWLASTGGDVRETRSLLRILRESLSYESGEERSLSHIYRFVYSIKRWVERQKNFPQEQLSDLRNTFIIDYQFKKNLSYSVRWAELLTRQES